MPRMIKIGQHIVGDSAPLALIAGPCVIENYESAREIAAELKVICDRLDVPLIFKASYDKANRTSAASFRGPGLDNGLKILADIKNEFDLPILSDIHRISEISEAARARAGAYSRCPPELPPAPPGSWTLWVASKITG